MRVKATRGCQSDGGSVFRALNQRFSDFLVEANLAEEELVSRKNGLKQNERDNDPLEPQ